MKIALAAITPRRSRTKVEASEALTAEYLERAAHYTACESQFFPTEAALFDWLDKQAARTPAQLILLDSQGKLFTSEEFARQLGRLRDSGTQRAVFAIGPANGWSADAKARAAFLFSLGRITLPHELARVVAAEQIYRALTILAGHPYHGGH